MCNKLLCPKEKLEKLEEESVDTAVILTLLLVVVAAVAARPMPRSEGRCVLAAC